MKKVFPIIIENSEIYQITLTIQQDWNLKDKLSRIKTFKDARKITTKNIVISIYDLEIILQDISNFSFNKILQKYASEIFYKNISPKLKALILDLRTLSNLSYWIIYLWKSQNKTNSKILQIEYKKLEQEIIESICYLIKDQKSSSIIWEINQEDIKNNFSEILRYIAYHQNEINKFKKDFYLNWASSKNIWLQFYNF